MRLSVAAALSVAIASCGPGPGPEAPERPERRVQVRVPSFAALDRDASGSLDTQELVRLALPYHDAWDLEQDGFVTLGELSRGLFAVLDRDGDDRISGVELALHARMILPRRARSLEAWDPSGDGVIDRRELREGLERLGLLRAYDADEDGQVTDLELTDALMAQLDADEDGLVSLAEWRAAGGEPGEISSDR